MSGREEFYNLMDEFEEKRTIITAHVFEKEDYAMEAAKALYNAGYRKGAKK